MTAENNNIVVVGAGGHGKVVADVARTAGFRVHGFVDDRAEQSPLPDIPLLGPLSVLDSLLVSGSFALVVAIGENHRRMELAEMLAAAGYGFATVVAPSAVVSAFAVIGPGTVLLPQAVVNAGARVGAHAILNTACSVDHDCLVGDYVHLSPGVRLSGNVRIGRGAHLGTGVSVIPGRSVGEWSTVGAGAVVVRDIGSRVVAVGVPAVERAPREEKGP
jgi:acetyltransferase EpsM